MLPKIGIVILNWNGWRDTLDCLALVRQLDYPASRSEIVLVDNGSHDESVARLRQQSGVTLLELPSNVGFAAANNVGIRRVLADGCDYVLLLNNDTIVPPDLLTSLLDVFYADRTAGVISPKIRYYDEPDRLWYAGGRLLQPRLILQMRGRGEVDTGQYDQPLVVDYAVGCCMLIRRAVFGQIGHLDECFFFYYEDVDFSCRATKAGFSVWYQPASVILHKVSYSTRNDLPRRTFLRAQSRVVFFCKHVHGIKFCLLLWLELIRIVRSLTRELRHGRADLVRSYVQGLLAGLRQI